MKLILVLDENDIYGCNDPDALNYNPDATANDGSVFMGDSCNTALTPQIGINQAEGGRPQWFQYLAATRIY